MRGRPFTSTYSRDTYIPTIPSTAMIMPPTSQRETMMEVNPDKTVFGIHYLDDGEIKRSRKCDT